MLFNLMIISLILNAISCELDNETFGKLLFQQLGIRNSKLHSLKRRNTLNNNNNNLTTTTTINHDLMLNLYSKLNNNQIAVNKPFNIIRSFNGTSIKCSLKPCNKIDTFKSKQSKRFNLFQISNIKETFQFNFNQLIDTKLEKLVKSDLELKFNFLDLFQNFHHSNLNNYNELKIDLYLNGKYVNLLDFNTTLIGLKTKLKRTHVHKIKMNHIIKNFYNEKKKFNLNLNLKIKFKTTIKSNNQFKLNNKIKSIREILLQSPFIIVYLNDGSAKYASNIQSPQVNDQKIQKSNKCNKRVFTISFKEIGWDKFIIEPKFLSSFYCSGSCDLPLDDTVMPTSHAILISLASQLKRFDYLPKVCCKPDKLSSKMFLFIDEFENIVIKKIDDIIVESCSCQ
jgi:hypothetical protein